MTSESVGLTMDKYEEEMYVLKVMSEKIIANEMMILDLMGLFSSDTYYHNIIISNKIVSAFVSLKLESTFKIMNNLNHEIDLKTEQYDHDFNNESDDESVDQIVVLGVDNLEFDTIATSESQRRTSLWIELEDLRQDNCSHYEYMCLMREFHNFLLFKNSSQLCDELLRKIRLLLRTEWPYMFEIEVILFRIDF